MLWYGHLKSIDRVLSPKPTAFGRCSNCDLFAPNQISVRGPHTHNKHSPTQRTQLTLQPSDLGQEIIKDYYRPLTRLNLTA